MIDLAEIYCSIQGESSFAGLPCIFIRTTGCNFRCNYCDTTYSYNTIFSLSAKEIAEKIKRYSPIKLVEITGGEPLLQDNVYLLFSILNNAGYKILLETNGSILLNKVPDYVVKIVDVKCPGSGHPNSFLLDNLKFLNEQDELKFVLMNRGDYLFAKEFFEKYLAASSNNIIFSPVIESLAPIDLSEWIIEDKLPVRLQLQLHKIIWGSDKTGV